jgi:hypothetical protein
MESRFAYSLPCWLFENLFSDGHVPGVMTWDVSSVEQAPALKSYTGKGRKTASIAFRLVFKERFNDLYHRLSETECVIDGEFFAISLMNLILLPRMRTVRSDNPIEGCCVLMKIEEKFSEVLRSFGQVL